MAKRKPLRVGKKDKKLIDLKMVLVLTIGIIMIGSIAGIVWQGDNMTVRSHEIAFKQLQFGYSAKINEKPYTFRYLPDDVISFDYDQTLTTSIRQNQGVIMVFNPNGENIDSIEAFRYELGNLLMEDIGKQTGAAITEENPAYTFPLLNCSNTTLATSYGVTYLKVVRGIKTGMSMEGACFVATVSSVTELSVFRDRLFYELLGVYDKK